MTTKVTAAARTRAMRQYRSIRVDEHLSMADSLLTVSARITHPLLADCRRAGNIIIAILPEYGKRCNRQESFFNPSYLLLNVKREGLLRTASPSLEVP